MNRVAMHVSAQPPGNWDAMCAASDAFFGSRAWLELLERSFGCRTVYASGPDAGLAVSVFRGGPFEVGYLGFPAGGSVGSALDLPTTLDALRSIDRDLRPVCVRLPVDADTHLPNETLPRQVNPETVIENLQDWSLASGKPVLKRNVRKARNSGLLVEHPSDPDVGESLYELYAATVRRNRGSLRYNDTYFRSLVTLAAADDRLDVMTATAKGAIAGFLVIARHGPASVYLHGGTHERFRRDSPSDLLFDQAIHRARDAGSARFNFMSSPVDQPSLVRYKEKWGGTTRDLSTLTLPLGATYPAFRIAEKLYSLLR